MRDLELVGLSGDAEHVLLRDQHEDFRIRIDDRLRAALRGDRVRLGQVENNMDSVLRPRDIQARIRSGESPEAVAAVAQVSLDRIMGYALPVLAEREHVCRQARQSGLRRKHASGPGRLLGTAVDHHLRNNGWDPEAANWDSWRRDDGRWSVTVAASSNGTPATFLFDAPGRYVVAHDDAARRLVGDEPPLSVEPESDEPRSGLPPVGLPSFGEDPLSAPEPATDLPAALEQVAGDQPPARVSALDRLRRQRTHADDPLPFDSDPAGADEDVEAIARLMAVGQSGPEPVGDHSVGEAEADAHAEPRRRRTSRRAVPSWDEIMFGSKPPG